MKGRAYSVSVANDDHAEEHSRRAYTPASAERSLSESNIVIFDCGNDRRAFNDFFEDAILAYNSKQKRADRKKSLDYLSALESGQEGYGKGSKREKAFYHSVIQIGNRDTLGVTDSDFDVEHWKSLKRNHRWHEAEQYVKKHLNKSEDREQMTAVLKEIGDGLQEKYPYCRFWGIIIHRDEPNGTDHMDVRYTIFTDGEKTGLSKRVSMNKGLAKMGFKTDKEKTALQHFQDAIKKDVEEAMKRRGYSRQYMSNTEKHMSTSMFKCLRDKQEAQETKDALDRQSLDLSGKIASLTELQEIREKEVVKLLDERKSLEKEKQVEQDTMDALKRQSLYLTGEITKLTELQKIREEEVIRMLDEKQSLEKETQWLRGRNKEMEAELEVRRKEKESLDRDLSDQRSQIRLMDEHTKELQKYETNLDKRQRSIEEFFYKTTKLQEQILRVLGDKNEYSSDQERQDALERCFQEWEDKFEAQKRALAGKEEDIQAKVAELLGLQDLYRKAESAYHKLNSEKMAESMMQWLRTKKYRTVKTKEIEKYNEKTKKQEKKQIVVKDDKGKAIWEEHSPIEDYYAYLKSREKRNQHPLTLEEMEILKRAEIEEQEGEYSYLP